jgi:hypothetical protein
MSLIMLQNLIATINMTPGQGRVQRAIDKIVSE